MEAKEKVIAAMKNAERPVSAGEIEKMTGLERKIVDKIFKELKIEDTIYSPIRCKWQLK